MKSIMQKLEEIIDLASELKIEIEEPVSKIDTPHLSEMVDLAADDEVFTNNNK